MVFNIQRSLSPKAEVVYWTPTAKPKNKDNEDVWKCFISGFNLSIHVSK
jgi:hypothetical protein